MNNPHIDKIRQVKKTFEDRWNDNGFSSTVMCDDGNERVLDDPGKIWSFIEDTIEKAMSWNASFEEGE